MNKNLTTLTTAFVLSFLSYNVAVQAQVNNDSKQEPLKAPGFVDLGLSVCWGTCNIGADSPEQSGNYFAFGETQEKQSYTWDSYKWCDGAETKLTRYNYDPGHGSVDYQYIMRSDDDVAKARLGGSWRIPTDKEWRELIDECEWKLVENGSDFGYRITGKKEGFTDRSIYLPAAGLRNGSNLYTSSGFYWSSTTGYVSESGMAKAWFINFSKTNKALALSGFMNGMTVRPVCNNDNRVITETIFYLADDNDVAEDAVQVNAASTDIVESDNVEWVDLTEADYLNVEEDPAEDEEMIFMVVEDMPEFPGGIENLLNFVRQNLNYPSFCREYNIQGRVLVQFTVNELGDVIDAEVVKSVHPLIDNEALRLVSIMPRWKPGMQRGKGVRVRYTIPLTFKLN